MSTTLQAVEPSEVILPGQSQPKPSAFMRIGIVRSVKAKFARHGFEKRIAALINSALAHEQEKLPAGSDPYQRLWKMADAEISQYVRDTGCDRTDLEAQIPAVTKLRALAQEAKPEVPAWLKPSTLLPVGFVTAAVSVILGIDHGLYLAAKQFVVLHLTHHI